MKRPHLVIGVIALGLTGCSGHGSSIDTSSVATSTGAMTVNAPQRVRRVEWRAVFKDWMHEGKFTAYHGCAAVREARRHVAAFAPDYSSIYADLRLLQRRACR